MSETQPDDTRPVQVVEDEPESLPENSNDDEIKADFNECRDDSLDRDSRVTKLGAQERPSDNFDLHELQLIEAALRKFRDEVQVVAPSNHNRESSENGAVDDQLGSVCQENPDLEKYHEIDLRISVSTLLQKVQTAKIHLCGAATKQERATPVSSGGPEQIWFQEHGLEESNIKEVVEAASKAAVAAAKAAEAVASSVAKNSETIESLLRRWTDSGKNSKEIVFGNVVEVIGENNKLEPIIEKDKDGQDAIMKNIERQNTITHWVLGLIVITSTLWRFGVVKYVLQVQNNITNPFQGISSMFDGFKGDHSHSHADDKRKFSNLKLPSLLPNEEGNKKHEDNSEDEDDKDNFFESVKGILPRPEDLPSHKR